MERKKTQLKLLITPRKMTAKLGVFSAAVSQAAGAQLVMYSHRGRQVYQGRRVISHRDHISHLPVELLRMILNHLGNPDRVAMALTSKTHMSVLESTRVVSTRRSSTTRQMRLAVLVRLHQWMPHGLTLCYSCVKFLPHTDNGLWHGDAKIRDDKLANKKALDLGPRCNSCARRDELETVKAAGNAQRLMRMIKYM